MIKEEEIKRQIREHTRKLLNPDDEIDKPIEHYELDPIDESGAYQVYEITYKKSIPSDKQVVAEYLSRQEARDLVRKYRNAITGDEVMTKGYGFEKMTVTTDYAE